MPANSSNARPMFIVTHERYIADTLVTILAQHGFTAVAAYRALEAVEKARQMRPWFVLMDFVMPDIDGAQAAIRITREQPDCEVLLYSSQNISIEQLRDAIRQQGCQSEIIPAPIPLSQLLARVRKSAALKGLLPSQNETVLVVDDEHVIADTLAIILEQHGVEAATAYNGKGAIEAARRLRPKLIVMGGVMPDMHGIEASKVILAEQPECKIAIFSGARATAELLNNARSEGYEFEILAKPFHRVHYSELEVDVTTAFRQHPGETLWRMLWQAVGIAVLGLPFWIVPLYLSVSGVNALLEHANVRISDGLDGWLRLLIVTPNMHKIHHSRLVKETNSNYSNIFSLWDRVCGTHTAWTDYRSLRYGLEGFDDKRKQRLIGLISEPFRAS